MPEGQDTTILFIYGLFRTILETDLKAVVRLVTLWARNIQTKFPEISVQTQWIEVRSNRKSFDKTGRPFQVDHFSRSDRSEILVDWIVPILGCSRIGT